MSLVPAFEIGVWNAWIFMPYFFVIIILVGKLKKDEEKEHGEKSMSARDCRSRFDNKQK